MLYLFKLTPHLVDRLERGASSYSQRSGKAGHGVTATKSCCAIECHWQACIRPGPHLAVTPKTRYGLLTEKRYSCKNTYRFHKRKKTSSSKSEIVCLTLIHLILMQHFLIFFFFLIFEKCAATCFVLNVIWELSEWESGSEFPGNRSHSSHTDRKWTATLGKFNSVVVHCEKDWIMWTFGVI